MQENHELNRCKQLTLTNAREIRRDGAETLRGRSDNGPKDRAHQVLGFWLPVEDRHDAGQISNNISLEDEMIDCVVANQ